MQVFYFIKIVQWERTLSTYQNTKLDYFNIKRRFSTIQACKKIYLP